MKQKPLIRVSAREWVDTEEDATTSSCMPRWQPIAFHFHLSRCEAVGQGQVAEHGFREHMDLPVLLPVSWSRGPRAQRAR